MCDAIVAALEHDDEEGNRRQPHLEEDVMCSALLLELRSNFSHSSTSTLAEHCGTEDRPI